MSELTITIPGNPIAKKRPRFARRGKFVTTYNPQESEEGKFICLMQNQIKEKQIPKGVPIHLNLWFYMPIPNSMSKKKRELGMAHTKKPDVDNMIKFFMDCANGILWHDDAQVVSVYASKAYGEQPSTCINLVW